MRNSRSHLTRSFQSSVQHSIWVRSSPRIRRAISSAALLFSRNQVLLSSSSNRFAQAFGYSISGWSMGLRRFPLDDESPQALVRWGESVVPAGILTRVSDAPHPHARGRLAGEAQDLAAGHQKAELLGQPRHLIGSHRLLHLPLQGGITLHPGEKVPELFERHPRLPVATHPTATAVGAHPSEAADPLPLAAGSASTNQYPPLPVGPPDPVALAQVARVAAMILLGVTLAIVGESRESDPR